MNPGGVVFFNFGTGKPMAGRKYVHMGERDGIYHLTARNKRNKDIIVQQAGTVAVTIVVKGKKLQAMSMSGNIVFEYEASVEESVRLYDFRKKMHFALFQEDKATMANTVKCMYSNSTTVLRGNVILVRAAIPIRRAALRRRSPACVRGQRVISQLFNKHPSDVVTCLTWLNS